MAIRHWVQKSMSPFLVIILSINLLLGCVSKGNIEVPASQPIPHPKLAEMQSLSLQDKDKVTYVGKSRKYYKNGIRVVVGKNQEIETIIEAFNREIYGQVPPNKRVLAGIQFAQGRMRNLRHWPSRMRAWFAASSMEVRVSEQ